MFMFNKQNNINKWINQSIDTIHLIQLDNKVNT